MLRPASTVFCFVLLAGLSACKDNGVPVSERLAQAKQLLAAGDAKKARLELEGALKADPRNAQVHFQLAKLDEATGNLPAAVQHYLFAAQPDARNLDAQLRVVDILLDSGRLGEALGRINATLGAFPNNPEVLAVRADIEERQGQDTQARADLDAVLARDGANPRALAVSALLKLKNKDHDGAAAAVQRGLDRDPNNLRLLQVRAAIAISSDAPDQAISAFQAIVHAAPQNVAAQRALAELRAEAGNVDEGLAGLKTAAAADPGDQDIQIALIDFLTAHGKSGDAVTSLKDLIKQHPDDTTYVLVLAEAYRKQGHADESRALLDDAAARLGNTPEARIIEVAQAKLDTNMEAYAAADARLDKVLAEDPNNPGALQTRAVVALKNGRSADAIADLLAVVRSEPTNGPAFNMLASAYVVAGDSKLAVEAMRRAVAVMPGDDTSQTRLAAFLQANGALEASREIMARLTLNKPDDPQVWIASGQLAIGRQAWDDASRAVTRLSGFADRAAETQTLKGAIAAAHGDMAGAMAAYRVAIDASPLPDAGLIGAYARAASTTGQAAAAAAYLQTRVASWTGDTQAAAWTSIMTLQADAGAFDKLEGTFQAFVKAAPKDLAPYRVYAGILAVRKDYARARAVVDQGVAAGASRWSLLMLKGAISEQAGDAKRALVDYQTALSANPVSLDAINNVASLMADLDSKNTAALQGLRDKLDAFVSSSDRHHADTVAWVDYRLGRFDEARSILTRIDAAKSPNPQVRFHLAAVLLASGDRTGGLALLDTVRGATFPGSTEAQALSAS